MPLLMPATIPWPPTYKLRKHRLAKHVKLRATHQGLEITVPFRFNLKYIPSILEENKSWITKKLSQLPFISKDILPVTIHLHALDQLWHIHYRPLNTENLSIKKSLAQGIILEGNVSNKELCKNKLRAWLKHQAKSYLISRLHSLSEKTRLPFSKVSIRNQRTLWGSCTVHAAISLNYKLIFLPERLVTYTIIHELCHTEFLNHSSKFWRLVSSHDPHWQQHKKELKRGDIYIPAWI